LTNIKLLSILTHIKKIILEKYSSGSRGAPAKGIGREIGARVRIPPSPLLKVCSFGYIPFLLQINKNTLDAYVIMRLFFLFICK
jgi:hypothetical protein